MSVGIDSDFWTWATKLPSRWCREGCEAIGLTTLHRGLMMNNISYIIRSKCNSLQMKNPKLYIKMM